MCNSDGFIKLQIHWNNDAVVPFIWPVNGKDYTIIKVGFDTYDGICVYVVEEPITVKLMRNALFFGKAHFKSEVEI
jgi:hypothetical protein